MAENRLTDEKLVILAKGGDEAAIEELYERYRITLKSKANLYFMVGADRDDVIQEGMIGLFYAIRNFDIEAGAAFRTFAEICIRRQIINAVKMAARKKHNPLNESVSINVTDNYYADEDPEEMVLLSELLSYISGNVDKIFSDFELSVWGFYVDGNSTQTIAKELGRSAKSIDNALTRMKKKVEKLLALY
ncbi:MAG: sigma-70 family RNA polymerase sigma factor [Clostridiales Family XIII bacterium]|jgi:RNA polymerase sporulation-specific sigma factor|nr:sigma-70 family RNA polymerase sigma factor [Clostridiales Family XIII bacterium]